MDAHDRLEAIQDILDRTEKNIEALTTSQVALPASQAVTDKMLQDLIALLTKANTNGKP